MIPVRLISVDDLIETLTRCASLADSAMYRIAHGQAVNGSNALKQIKDEALDAIARAEDTEEPK